MTREHALSIPANEIRGCDLHEWHIVIVECCHCHMARVMHHKFLKDARHRDLLLSEMKFWCRSCRRGGPHTVSVTKAPAHY
ncbi:MAG TPA: hypothetical protein VHY80_16710 [Stellaceae bacterium]|nr:hypothetical protein [Stellaceae bacterium]